MALKLGVDNVFETDILRSLIAQIEEVSKVTYQPENVHQAPAFRVIADHLRCLSFAIADGVQPSNVDRGYVLRKVLRRAVRYGRQLGLEEPFLGKVFPRLLKEMGNDYRELEMAKDRIIDILTAEEEAFFRTLRRGGNILNQIVEKAQKESSKTISGEDAFKLKDTYGLPLDEILLLAKDSELTVDKNRYQELEQQAKERSRNSQKVTMQIASENLFGDLVQKEGETSFVGYAQGSATSLVKAIVVDGTFVDKLLEGQEGIVILEATPFYAEMGGQVGDHGRIASQNGEFEVMQCHAPYKGIIAHVGKMTKGSLDVGQTVQASINEARRQQIANNHTATHLLHWALHKVLGGHIKQAGSVVDAERLRFDFSHHKGLTDVEIEKIETLVNEKIRENRLVEAYEISYEEAQKKNEIKQFFGEKYGSKVRVIDIEFSKELCGGTHTRQLGTIGLFRIAKESSIAAGIRRIEAVTGAAAESFSRQSEQLLVNLAELLKTQVPKLSSRLEKLLEENASLEQQLKALRKGSIEKLVNELIEKSETIDGISLLTARLDLSVEEMRSCADELTSKLTSGVIVLATVSSVDNCQLLVRVSDDLTHKGIKANEIIKEIAPLVKGSGGGKPNSAQAGGKDPEGIMDALNLAKQFVKRIVTVKTT